MIRHLCALGVVLLLAACGGGCGSSSSGSGGGGSTSTPPPPALNNFTTVTVDDGPAVLNTGPNAYTDDDVAFVSVTICAPGSTSNCQTVDHVQLDTGSVGLRIFRSVLSSSLLSALPDQMDASSNPVGECYGYVDGYVFGSVRQADFQIGGESVANMPFQVISDTGAFANVPSSCSSGGGTNLNTVQAFGANGIIGIGVTTTDCGSSCGSGGSAAATYYDCPSSGCGSITARSSVTAAPFQQLPNPVAAMGVDNNGTILNLPAAPAAGEATMTGTLYFGIGTQTNNGLGSAKIITTTNSNSFNGSGLVTVNYNSQALNESFIDSGTSLYIFVDNSIAACSQSALSGLYCPTSPVNLSPTFNGVNGAISGAFTLDSAQVLLTTSNAVIPGIGGNPNTFSNSMPFPNSFDFGLPFFFGRPVYTAIEGRTAGGVAGPYFAF